MAIRTFCTTLGFGMAVLATLPAAAFGTAEASAQAQAAAERQPAEIVSLDPGAFSKPSAFSIDGGNASLGQVFQGEAGAISYQPSSQPAPPPEPGSLPLLGVAAVALLLAQLRRSRRPTP